MKDDIVEVTVNDINEVVKITFNGININPENFRFLTGAIIVDDNLKPNNTIIFTPDQVNIVHESNSDDDDSAPPCQSCFKAQYTMQNDDGEYLCDSCYSASNNDGSVEA